MAVSEIWTFLYLFAVAAAEDQNMQLKHRVQWIQIAQGGFEEDEQPTYRIIMFHVGQEISIAFHFIYIVAFSYRQ